MSSSSHFVNDWYLNIHCCDGSVCLYRSSIHHWSASGWKLRQNGSSW